MKRLLQLISLAGLLATIIPPILFFTGHISHAQQNLFMLIGAIAWFVGALFWLGGKEKTT